MAERLHLHFSLALEKEMATHSSVLAWRIPGTGEPGGLPSMGSHSRTRLKRLSSNLAAAATYNGNKPEKEYTHAHAHTHIWHFAVHLKLTQHCKLTVLTIHQF